MQILEFYHKDQKSPESIQRFEINTSHSPIKSMMRCGTLRHGVNTLGAIGYAGKQRRHHHPGLNTILHQILHCLQTSGSTIP